MSEPQQPSGGSILTDSFDLIDTTVESAGEIVTNVMPSGVPQPEAAAPAAEQMPEPWDAETEAMLAECEALHPVPDLPETPAEAPSQTRGLTL